MNQVIASHGWAGDATVWRGWQRRFKALGWHWDAVERGYGQREPHQPTWTEQPGQRLVIAHSLGVHLLPENVLRTADAVVRLAGIAAFDPAGAAGRTLAVALKGMASCLGTADESLMLLRHIVDNDLSYDEFCRLITPSPTQTSRALGEWWGTTRPREDGSEFATVTVAQPLVTWR